MEKLNPEKLNQCVCRIDRMPLWCVGILLLAITFAPYLILGEGSVFPVHDQLDETIMTYGRDPGKRYAAVGSFVYFAVQVPASVSRLCGTISHCQYSGVLWDVRQR